MSGHMNTTQPTNGPTSVLGYYASTHISSANAGVLRRSNALGGSSLAAIRYVVEPPADRLASAPNPDLAGLLNWPGFAGGNVKPFNKRDLQERKLIHTIDYNWTSLSRAQKQQVRDYVDRWGADCKPTTVDATDGTRNHEEFLRASCWRGTTRQRHLPKCQSHNSGNSKMPKLGEIPIGIEGVDIMPCGCRWDHARLEIWMTCRGLWNNRKSITAQGTRPIAIMRDEARDAFFDMFDEFLGDVSLDTLNKWLMNRPNITFAFHQLATPTVLPALVLRHHNG